jgi:O-antigen/teichoic acid export membrane protein
MFVSPSPHAFFTFQLGIGMLEIAGLAWMAHRLLPPVPKGQCIHWELAPLKPVLKFSMSIAFTSSVWVLVTQTDKLVLSKILPLADYGYFTVAVLVASGIMVVSGPISSAIMPRMVRMHAEGKHDELISVYRQATQLVTVTAIPAALVLIFLAPQVLWAWTGNLDLVQRVAPVLSLYATGYAFLSVSAFPYYLQYAKGNLRLHLIGSAMFLVLLIPSVIWAASRFGMGGAAWAWLVSNAIYLLLWTPLVHRKSDRGLHLDWLLFDIAFPLAMPIAAAAVFAHFMPWFDGRLSLAIQLVAVGAFFMVLALPLAGRIRPLTRGFQFGK